MRGVQKFVYRLNRRNKFNSVNTANYTDHNPPRTQVVKLKICRLALDKKNLE